MRRIHHRRVGICLFCGGLLKHAQGYVLLEARNYSPLAAVRLRPLRHLEAHKRCYRAAVSKSDASS